MAGQAGPSGQRNLPDAGVHQQAEAVAASSGRRFLLGPAAAEAPAGGEENECRICYNLFDLDRHAPKLLECLHTFCLQCLRQMHLRAARSPRSRASSDGEDNGAAIQCPLCCHRTALPGGSVHNLPVNTKRVEAGLLQLNGWAAAPRRQARLSEPAPGPARQRPLPEQSGQGASPSAAAGASHTAEDSLGAPEAGSDLCCVSWRKVVGGGCVVLAALLLAAAWLRWVSLPIFLLVAVGLIFCSTLPFMVFYFRFSTEPRTIFLRRRAASSG